MKDHGFGRVRWKALNLVAHPRALWITLGGEHNAHRGSRVPEHVGHRLGLMKRSVHGVLEQHRKVASHAKKDRLGLWIAHSAVELHHVRLTLGIDHETRIEKARVGGAFGLHAREHGTNDLSHHTSMHLRRHHGCGRVGTHAASVRAGVAIAHSLMVLAGGERKGMLTVTHHNETRLFALEKVFDDHPRASVAELIAHEHGIDCSMRLSNGEGDDHALACSQAIGLHHNGSAARLNVCAGRRRI